MTPRFRQATFLLQVLAKWLPSYLVNQMRGRPAPAHVLFCMADHFEPGHGGATAELQRERLALLLREYPRLADAHKDSRGNVPKRTWFLPPHDHRHGNLRALVSLCERGYGEVELHLHHGKTAPDTAANLEHTIRLCLRDYARFGVFGHQQGQKRYGFIHGDWALANSRRDGRYCGVDAELDVLAETGCYADFTFPSCDECNPRQINSLFYASNNPTQRIRYDHGTPVRHGVIGSGVMIIQGPLHPIFLRRSPLGLRAFGDDVAHGKPGTPQRIAAWIDTWIHIEGKPNWIVVKVHTHGAVDVDAVLGESMHQTFRHLETACNDGRKYILHYVSARELFNIIKAAEAGESGDPEEFRNYQIAAPSFDASPQVLGASPELQQAVAQTYAG